MPARTKQPSINDLFNLAVDELDRSINKPNILRYGEKKYPEQERFHRTNKPGRFVSGGNRGGKTDAEVVEAIWWASNTHPFLERPKTWGTGPLQLRMVVVDVAKGVEQIMLPKFKRWMTKSMLLDGSWEKSWDSDAMILTFSNGSTIDFVTHGMTLDKHGGVPRHMIFFDEEPPQPIFNEGMMRLVDYKGWWVIAATPVKGMGWTYDLLWEPALVNPDGKVATFVLSAAQNPYVAAETEDMDFYTIGMSKEERDMREGGAFVARSGLVFPNFAMNLDKFVVDPSIIGIPPKNWDWYSSTDFGINNPTAWLWHAVAPHGGIITFAEHFSADLNVPQHAQIVKQREASWGKEPELRVGDPAGKQRQGVTGTSYIMEYAVRGINISVEGIPHEVSIGIEKMQQYFRLSAHSPWCKVLGVEEAPWWIISSNCVNFVRELKKLRWATYASERQAYDTNRKDEVHKKDDHAFDSARYFSTIMPDLTPDHDELTTPAEEAVTIPYSELLYRMAQDDNVTYAEDDQEQEPWETTITYGDAYEEAY